MRVEDSGDEFTVGHDFAPKEREILVERGPLHYLSEHGEQVSGDADGEGEPRRGEAGEGPGGPNRAVSR